MEMRPPSSHDFKARFVSINTNTSGYKFKNRINQVIVIISLVTTSD